MNPDIFTLQTLALLCTDGKIEDIRAFAEQILPSLPKESQKSFCGHLIGNSERCNDLPCTTSIIHLAETAASGGQVEVFTYLWDTFLFPRGITSISWPCLATAAYQGSIPLAQAYWDRDRDCFSTIGPRAVYPPIAKRPLQVEKAIRSDRFEYIDFMLAHGADTKGGFWGKDILRMVVRCAVDDATTLKRIRFLVSRGVKAAGSTALREVVAGGSVVLASCLIDSGADVDDVVEPGKTSSLMVAASNGDQEMVELLLDRGANVDLVDREGRDAIAIADRSGHSSIVRILQAHGCALAALKTVG